MGKALELYTYRPNQQKSGLPFFSIMSGVDINASNRGFFAL